jgi:hypothetical protein
LLRARTEMLDHLMLDYLQIITLCAALLGHVARGVDEIHSPGLLLRSMEFVSDARVV